MPGTAGGNDVEIVIVNGVEYIVYLEFGWSKQAPRGMVRIALANMVKRIPLKMKGIVR